MVPNDIYISLLTIHHGLNSFSLVFLLKAIEDFLWNLVKPEATGRRRGGPMLGEDGEVVVLVIIGRE